MRERAEWSDSGWIGADQDDDLDRRLAEEDEVFEPRRPHVMTVLGPVEPAALGVTLVQERVAAIPSEVEGDPDPCLDDVHAAVVELEDLYAAGGRAIVDATTPDRGRNAVALRRIAERAPVHLVAVTGSDDFRTAGFGGERGERQALEEMAAAFERDATEGIEGTGVRAGAIVAQVGTGGGKYGGETGLRAGALAHQTTGVPLVVRADRSSDANEALVILRDAGVAPPRVSVGGFGVRPEMSELRSLLATGAFVAFDRIVSTEAWSEAEQAAAIRTLVDAGYGDQVLLSPGLQRRSLLRAYGGGPGWAWLLERFPLMLMEVGLEAPAVRRLLVDNPARALTIAREQR